MCVRARASRNLYMYGLALITKQNCMIFKEEFTVYNDNKLHCNRVTCVSIKHSIAAGMFIYRLMAIQQPHVHRMWYF